MYMNVIWVYVFKEVEIWKCVKERRVKYNYTRQGIRCTERKVFSKLK